MLSQNFHINVNSQRDALVERSPFTHSVVIYLLISNND